MDVKKQAQTIAHILPTLMRQLFTIEDDPVEKLPLAQLRVCDLLYHQARPMSALSRELGVSLSAVTQIADRLERGHLVKRLGDETDRRLRCLTLTKRGTDMMRRREEAHVQRILAVLEALPATARSEILAALECLQQASVVRERCAPCV